jgi:hypothetical protein
MSKATASDVTNRTPTPYALPAACTVSATRVAAAASARVGTDTTALRYIPMAVAAPGMSVALSEFGFHVWRTTAWSATSRLREEAVLNNSQQRSGLPSRVPRLLFVLNRCNHTFELIQRDIGLLAGGM